MRRFFSNSVSIEAIKKLRSASGAPLSDCKAALQESNGPEEAFEWLRRKGIAQASKMTSREAKEGLIAVSVSADGRKGSIIELNTETDFVSRNERFEQLAETVADVVLTSSAGWKNQQPKGGALAQCGSTRFLSTANFLHALIPNSSPPTTLGGSLMDAVTVLRENIVLRRVALLEVNEGSTIGSYIHGSGKRGRTGRAGALVSLVSSKEGDARPPLDVAKKLAMHCVAAKPQFLGAKNIPSVVLEQESSILREQAANSGKPKGIIDKMVEGRLQKFFEESTLLGQSHMIEAEAPRVSEFLTSQFASVEGFARFAVGEYIPPYLRPDQDTEVS